MCDFRRGGGQPPSQIVTPFQEQDSRCWHGLDEEFHSVNLATLPTIPDVRHIRIILLHPGEFDRARDRPKINRGAAPPAAPAAPGFPDPNW